ncbi:MAG: ATP-binding protein, partial [Pyrobaculum sp.]
EAWRLTGGNPRALERLYATGWSAEKVVDSLVREKGVDALVATLGEAERELLETAVEDPDVLFTREGMPLLNKLVELNLALDISERKPHLWIGERPPERDPEIGVGRRVAWQTPLHREAVRRAVESVRP